MFLQSVMKRIQIPYLWGRKVTWWDCDRDDRTQFADLMIILTDRISAVLHFPGADTPPSDQPSRQRPQAAFHRTGTGAHWASAWWRVNQWNYDYQETDLVTCWNKSPRSPHSWTWRPLSSCQEVFPHLQLSSHVGETSRLGFFFSLSYY